VVNKRAVSKGEADKIIAIEEDHWNDVKSLDIAPAKLSRSVSAFANTAGGEMFVGIDETKLGPVKKRSWRGFSDPESANAHIQVFEGLMPLGGHYEATFLTSEDYPGLVLHITVFKAKSITSATDGTPYLRRNAQNLPVVIYAGTRRIYRL
jgi:ATP-dependent DNA helicase RecG